MACGSRSRHRVREGVAHSAERREMFVPALKSGIRLAFLFYFDDDLSENHALHPRQPRAADRQREQPLAWTRSGAAQCRAPDYHAGVRAAASLAIHPAVLSECGVFPAND